jgi:Rrf2 family protein
MLDLTFNSSGNPVRLQEISTRQSISLHYLEQLFRKLRTGKVVKSVRGPGGGYVLARSMDEISVKDVLDCVGENINPARDIVGIPSSGIEIMKDESGNDINGIVDSSTSLRVTSKTWAISCRNTSQQQRWAIFLASLVKPMLLTLTPRMLSDQLSVTTLGK